MTQGIRITAGSLADLVRGGEATPRAHARVQLGSVVDVSGRPHIVQHAAWEGLYLRRADRPREPSTYSPLTGPLLAANPQLLVAERGTPVDVVVSRHDRARGIVVDGLAPDATLGVAYLRPDGELVTQRLPVMPLGVERRAPHVLATIAPAGAMPGHEVELSIGSAGRPAVYRGTDLVERSGDDADLQDIAEALTRDLRDSRQLVEAAGQEWAIGHIRVEGRYQPFYGGAEWHPRGPRLIFGTGDRAAGVPPAVLDDRIRPHEIAHLVHRGLGDLAVASEDAPLSHPDARSMVEGAADAWREAINGHTSTPGRAVGLTDRDVARPDDPANAIQLFTTLARADSARAPEVDVSLAGRSNRHEYGESGVLSHLLHNLRRDGQPFAQATDRLLVDVMAATARGDVPATMRGALDALEGGAWVRWPDPQHPARERLARELARARGAGEAGSPI